MPSEIGLSLSLGALAFFKRARAGVRLCVLCNLLY
jgi:hypothetical protein